MNPDGLQKRYEVRRLHMTTDQRGEEVAVAVLVDHPVFVLEYTKDPHAAVALAAYAKSCERDRPHLAADLREALREQPECECDEPCCQWCEIHGDTGNAVLEDEEL